ncbi:HupE/UreJ family protein [Methylosinus sp. H3A]|uniref:HupE/UreJ family protein n=1 Tax=Methylosinus sp. H3A TaxID=2785786 RepID=UPI0018C2E21C|nr:HupE/UreJ family protein [Methylosinus sp. H3A]MBG0810904.1 HupE/UreJ family protein [Methylosinus sp. H3A]
MNFRVRPATAIFAFFALASSFLASSLVCSPAFAHTGDISSAKIVPETGDRYRVDVGFLGTDIERMFQETQEERAGVDLSPPGVLEAEIGKFIVRRVDLRNAEGKLCASKVVYAGEDPTNPYDAKVSLQFDCSGVAGPILYDPARLMTTQGKRAKQLVSIGERPDQPVLTPEQRVGATPGPGQVLIFPDDGAVDLSKPLLTPTPWELAPKFLHAGIEHIMTGYDHLCFLLAVVLWASRIWPVVKIVTAFTASHSVTLTLAALNIVTLPSLWVEIAIALSIVYVAVENFFTRVTDTRWRDTFLFGFIHGFGFASGLIEIGVPQRAVVPALASFNIGVEVGQIGVVLVVVPLLLALDRFSDKGKRSPKIVYPCSALIALFGLYWAAERVGLLG